MTDSKKTARYTSILALFVTLNLAVIPILLLMRIAQYFFLSSSVAIPTNIFSLEWLGILQDISLWIKISLVLLIPFFFLSIGRKWAGMILFAAVFLFYACLDWALFNFFLVTRVPLDQVIFSYTVKEMIMIAGSSVQLSFIMFLPFFLLLFLTGMVVFLFARIRISKVVIFLCLISFVTLIFIQRWIVGPAEKMENGFDTFVQINKTSYLIRKGYTHLTRDQTPESETVIREAANRYHEANPEFNYLGPAYPFLHNEKNDDVLGKWFDLRPEKPNLVFIIVESLSSCFMGENALYGSFTPFLDSLGAQSLYWDNFLATSERTFNVLPAIFGSLPPGDPTFIREMSKIPLHFSFIRYLHENGYYTSFFYGGNPEFNYMKDFLERQETDHIITGFDPKYQKEIVQGEYFWGHADEELYARSLEIMDSLKKSPSLNIFLTLSLHSPFNPPDKAVFLKQAEERIRKGNARYSKQEILKFRDILATVLYTDDALRKFMNAYRKKAGYSNTIFIITGDHAIPEMNVSGFSILEKYHVPLIIYSPLLNTKREFHSISSHFDIAPTFLSLLRNKYDIKTGSRSTWMGTGIDTAVKIRNLHKLPFILNNKEIIEYLDGNNFLSRNESYRLTPDFDLKRDDNPALLASLKKELNDFKILNTYVCRENKLIPAGLFFQKLMDSAAIKVKDTSWFSSLDSVSEFRALVNAQKLDPKFRLITLKVQIDLLTRETEEQKLPPIVFSINREKGKNVLWQPCTMPDCKQIFTEKGKWHTINVEEEFDISNLKNKQDLWLKLYLWRQTAGYARYKNSHISIMGYF